MLCQGCAPAYWLGARVLYDKAPSPPAVELNVSYDPAAPADPKRQLDLYLPGTRDFPTVVFVHGGGWAWGDRTQTFGGADVYRNVGRFLAGRGIATAVIGYRLVWPLDWHRRSATWRAPLRGCKAISPTRADGRTGSS